MYRAWTRRAIEEIAEEVLQRMVREGEFSLPSSTVPQEEEDDDDNGE